MKDNAKNAENTARALKRRSAALAGLMIVALSLAACGGGSSHRPGVASAGGTTTTAPASGSSTSSGSSLQFAQCMRSHGVTNFPDPDSNGELPKPQVLDARKNNPLGFDAATSACQHLLPNGGNGPTPADVQQDWNDDRNFAQCMRSHGVTNFPDATSDTHGRPTFNLQSIGIDQNAPQITAKAQECQSLLHLSSLPRVSRS